MPIDGVSLLFFEPFDLLRMHAININITIVCTATIMNGIISRIKVGLFHWEASRKLEKVACWVLVLVAAVAVVVVVVAVVAVVGVGVVGVVGVVVGVVGGVVVVVAVVVC